MYFTHWPWFLNFGLVKVLKPPFLQAAEARFLRLYAEVTGDRGAPIRVGKCYYAVCLSLEEVMELVRLDERPDGALPSAGTSAKRGDSADKNLPRNRAIHRVWPDFPVRALMDKSVATVKADVEAGSTLADALGKHAKVFETSETLSSWLLGLVDEWSERDGKVYSVRSHTY